MLKAYETSEQAAARPEGPQWLDCVNIAYVSLALAIQIIGFVLDFTLSENANYIPDDLGFGDGQWGDLVGGSSQILRAVLMVICGPVLARFDSLQSSAFALAVAAAAAIIFPKSTYYDVWLTARMLYTVPAACFFALGVEIAMTHSPVSHHGLVIALIAAGSGLSDALATSLERIFTTSWRGSFYVDTALLLALATVCLVVGYITGTKGSRRMLPCTDNLYDIMNIYQAFGRVLTSSPAMACLAVACFCQGAFDATQTLMQQWLSKDLGLKPHEVAGLMIGMPFVQLTGSVVMGIAADAARRHGIHFWISAVAFGVIGIVAALAMTHTNRSTAIFWFWFTLEQSMYFANGLMVPDLVILLPTRLTATAVGFSFGCRTAAYAVFASMAQHQADTNRAEHATLDHHPAIYADSIVLLSCVSLLQVPACLLGVLLLKRDETRIRQAAAETRPLLDKELQGKGPF